jgi:hypothetical protein
VLARGGGVEENAARFGGSAKLHASSAVRWRRVQAVAAEAVLAQRQRPGGVADARAGVAQVHGDELSRHLSSKQSNQAALWARDHVASSAPAAAQRGARAKCAAVAPLGAAYDEARYADSAPLQEAAAASSAASSAAAFTSSESVTTAMPRRRSSGSTVRSASSVAVRSAPPSCATSTAPGEEQRSSRRATSQPRVLRGSHLRAETQHAKPRQTCMRSMRAAQRPPTHP